MTETPSAAQAEPVKIKIGQVIDLAKQGRKEILPTLRALLDAHPELWQHYGDMGLQAQEHWLHLFSGQNLYLNECARRNAEALRDSLAGTDAGPLEKLQASRIVALHLQLAYYESLLGKYEMSPQTKVVDYLNERSVVVCRRLQEAMINLARIRKLLPGVLKIDLVISGEIEAKVSDSETSPSQPQADEMPTRISVPKNRVKDLLAAIQN